METYKTVADYISNSGEWEEALILLREIVISTKMKETVKWGFPVYMVDNKNVVGLGAFKPYVGIWFFQGVFLKDKNKKLVNAQEGKTKAMRQWRFDSVKEVKKEAKTIRAYLEEAIANQEQGLAMKPERKKSLQIPEALANALLENAPLKKSFDVLTPGKKREFAEYISEAKRETTRFSRLDKIIPMILNGTGLNDKYKK